MKASFGNLLPSHKVSQHLFFVNPLSAAAELRNGVAPGGRGRTGMAKSLSAGSYVDIGAKKTYVHDVNKNGTLSGKKLFCDMGLEGMTTDNE
ncbi:MAG: hypothetical protein HQ555_12435, partial [Candidatus Aminicenantes bacterium]|nr:hypothetical protein [Candidatus Aminicenantes bacterium]